MENSVWLPWIPLIVVMVISTCFNNSCEKWSKKKQLDEHHEEAFFMDYGTSRQEKSFKKIEAEMRQDGYNSKEIADIKRRALEREIACMKIRAQFAMGVEPTAT